MQMLYDSDSFVVVHLQANEPAEGETPKAAEAEAPKPAEAQPESTQAKTDEQGAQP